MPKLIEEHSTINSKQFLRYGISFRHLEISKFGLWWRWIVTCLFNEGHERSWAEIKAAAQKGEVFARVDFCGRILWTNVYHTNPKGSFTKRISEES